MVDGVDSPDLTKKPMSLQFYFGRYMEELLRASDVDKENRIKRTFLSIIRGEDSVFILKKSPLDITKSLKEEFDSMKKEKLLSESWFDSDDYQNAISRAKVFSKRNEVFTDDLDQALDKEIQRLKKEGKLSFIVKEELDLG